MNEAIKCFYLILLADNTQYSNRDTDGRLIPIMTHSSRNMTVMLPYLLTHIRGILCFSEHRQINPPLEEIKNAFRRIKNMGWLRNSASCDQNKFYETKDFFFIPCVTVVKKTGGTYEDYPSKVSSHKHR